MFYRFENDADPYIVDITKSEKENFIRMLEVGYRERLFTGFIPLFDKNINVKEVTPIPNEAMDNYNNTLLSKRIRYSDIENLSSSIGDFVDDYVEDEDYTVNTKVVLGGENYKEFEVRYYRLNIALVIKAAQEATCTLNIYPIKGKDQEYYIDRICKQANILRESFNFEVRTHDKEGNTNIKEIVVTAKPNSLFYYGTATVKLTPPFKTFHIKLSDPSVNSRLVPNFRTQGSKYNVLNQFNLTTINDNISHSNLITSLFSSLNRTEYRHLADPLEDNANLLDFKLMKYESSATNKFYNRLINHCTQYISLDDFSNSTVPSDFLNEGCFDNYIQMFNRYHGGCYTNNSIRNMSSTELRNAYNYLGNIISFGSLVKFVDGGAFTACNPKVLIVHPNVNFAPSVRDFFFNNRVKTIYYSKKSRPFLLYLQFNSTNSSWSPSQEDQLATNWFTSRGVTLKKIDLDKVS